MNVKPIQVVLGGVILLVLGVVFDVILRHTVNRGLAVELAGEAPLALDGGETIRGRLLSSPDGVVLTVDGEEKPLTANHQGEVELPFKGERPGLHVARLDMASKGQTREGVRLWERAVEVGAMVGPFESPDHWHACAVQLHVRQALLDDFLSPQVATQLSSLKELPSTPPVRAATAHFTWAGDGVDALVHLDFVTGTDLDVRGHLAIAVDVQQELQLTRRGELEISGRQVAAWHGLFKARVAVAVSSLVGGLSGQGFAEGAQQGHAMIDSKVNEKIAGVVDEKLQELRKVVPLPGPFPLEGVSFRWRYCRAVEIVAGRSGTVGFDVEERVPQHEAAAKFGLVQTPASPTPAVSLTGAGNVEVDFSPVLLNSLLDAAWRSGKLTQLMNDPRWLGAINQQHGDTELDFKVQSVEPLLPPFLEPAENGALLRMAETRLMLAVKGTDRPRDVRLFAEIHVDPRFDAAHDGLVLAYSLSDLASTCHDPDASSGKVLLIPCYAELLRAVEDHQLETAENSPTQSLALSLRRVLQALPVKLTHIHPEVLASEGQAWFRVSAEMAPASP